MKKVTLLRHAKSSWADANQQDVDRPLNNRGLRDAPVMAQRLLDQDCIPDLILCSAAIRTRQTATFFLETFANKVANTQVEIEYHDKLYLASPGTLLDYIQQTNSDIEHLMIIAHNPGLEMLGRQMHPDAPTAMPTCAVLHFALHSESFIIEPETQIDLLIHDFPKNV